MTRIAFIGGGNMARSLIGGLLATGHAAADIRVLRALSASDIPGRRAARLYRRRAAAAAEFERAKALAVVGLVLGFTLWFFGFMTVGAEWFLMWQSQNWNGQQAAFRIIACIGIVLVFLGQRDAEPAR